MQRIIAAMAVDIIVTAPQRDVRSLAGALDVPSETAKSILEADDSRFRGGQVREDGGWLGRAARDRRGSGEWFGMRTRGLTFFRRGEHHRTQRMNDIAP